MLCVVAFGWDGMGEDGVCWVRGNARMGLGGCLGGGVEDLDTCSGFSSWKEEWK